ncbi:amidohydrolase 2 [Lunatimonas lonarensis]|uniref:Amidohydrolase 2 n=1 Tax=Lunatimonas lonarensis TaxID=1232681 RepID=R7ZQB2_9BACT|nr:amidohydrolase family protein [Lunatimonas lonarensis]EON76272.1 amidohydrolase 2 [Lunatimonas lonarensis]
MAPEPISRFGGFFYMNRRDFVVKASIFGAATWVGSGMKARSSAVWDNIPLVDTHLHLWDRREMDYPWLSGVLDRDFLPVDFEVASEALPISKMVFVECGRRPDQYLQEVDWVLDRSKEDPRIRGMVAYFPLEKGLQSEQEMESLVSRGIVRGIRRGISEELVENPRFLEGISMLRRHGLGFDLNVSPSLMEASIRLVRRYPDLTFVLNHIGNPDIRGGGDFDLWKRQMRVLGKFENVVCKVSGVITKANLDAWRFADLVPYLDHVFMAFGMDRLVFGGDWPVVLRAGSYRQWADVFLQYTASLSKNERELVYHANAERIYRI